MIKLKIGKFITKNTVLILIVATVLLIPSVFGFLNSKINYDILSYLPQDINSTKGQEILDKDFSNAATSMLILENRTEYEISKVKDDISKIDGVSEVISRENIVSSIFPKEILPEEISKIFYSDNSTLMFIKFDTSASSEKTQEAVGKIRDTAGEDSYLSGIAPIVKDTKDLSDKETPIYTIIAVVLSMVVLTLLTKSTFIPIFFLISIGYAIMYNMGTNMFLGEISYLTKAIAAVLQLAVTMDYSIFLYHRYEEERSKYEDHKKAMELAIDKTLAALGGSSLTTIAGFLALVVMRLSLGKDIGIVMVKGVIFGVICGVTVLPSLILVFDKLIHKFQHKVLLPKFDKVAKLISTHKLIFLLLGMLLLIPSIYGAQNYKVYYNLDKSLPRDLDSIVSMNKLKKDYNMQSTHFIIVNDQLGDSEMSELTSSLKKISGIQSVLSGNSIKGTSIPMEIMPDEITDTFKKNGYQLIMVNSEYKTASDEVHKQIKEINRLIKEYDKNGFLTGEAPLTDDLTGIAEKDFKNVNLLSISVVFIIIMITLKSISLPVLLILAIELAIQMNMAVPFYMDQTIPFVASIIIGTIQLGSTIDYSILMTTRWIEEIKNGADRLSAIETTVRETAGSIVTSALSFIAATTGVGFYSDMEIVSVFGHMMARGAIFSMLIIIFCLPSIIYFSTPIILKTTKGLKSNVQKEVELEGEVKEI